jgi:hypothetical protein
VRRLGLTPHLFARPLKGTVYLLGEDHGEVLRQCTVELVVLSISVACWSQTWHVVDVW